MGLKAKTTILLMALLMSLTPTMADVSRREFINYNASDGLADNSAHTINCTYTGRLVITTMGQINFFDGQRFSFIDPSEENLYPLSEYYGNYHLYFDKFHHIWLKNTHNVTCVNLTTEKFVKSVEDEFKTFGMEDEVKDLFVDSNGIVWLLTDQGLFNVKTQSTLKIRKDMNLQDLEVYNERYLMLFFKNGLMEMFDLQSGQKVHESAPYDAKVAPTYNSSSVITMAGDTLYQIRNGAKEAVLNLFDIPRKEWKEIIRVPYHLNNIATKDTLLFVPCEYGYWVYDKTLKIAKHFESLKMENGRLLETNLNVMAVDRQGGLWVGTEGRGLLYSKPYQTPFYVYSWDDPKSMEYAKYLEGMEQSGTFRGKRVNCVYRDSRGWSWVGTSQGLQIYRKQSDVLPQIITKRDGLLNNVVHSIVEDHAHHIWVSTSYGISCVTIDDDKVHYIFSYNNRDHVPNESFINGLATCLPNGMVVMQSIDHIITFNPSSMKTLDNKYQFKMYPKLTRLQVNGNEIRTGQELDGKVILEKAISRVREIDLNYDQNSVSLVFTALNFFRPIQTCYRVRIKGLQDEWRVYTYFNSGGMVDSKGMLHLPMLGLRPGTYEIEIQASLVPDVWDTEPYLWVVNVNEPWWRTTGLFLAMIGLLTLLLALNAYYYLKNANLKVMRDSGEVGLLKRIHNFAERCNNRTGEVLEPSTEEIMGVAEEQQQNDLSPEFIQTMIRIMPMVLSAKPTRLTIRELSDRAGVDVEKFYSLVSANIYKSPRSMVRMLMLKRAEDLLISTDKTMEEIAKECRFVTPNHFIALFFHTHHLTPEEYRRKR